jgi:NTP pyrophosphatase (non-canonical NTP hydrolase)
MTLNEYQDLMLKTKKAKGLYYTGIALAGEVGEVCNEIKKWDRDDYQVMTEERHTKLVYELGDAMWYLASLADDLGVSLEEVARRNIRKLEERYLHKQRADAGVIG